MTGVFNAFLAVYLLTVIHNVSCLDTYEEGKFYRTESSLTEVPTDIPPFAIEIHLNNNSITNIKADDFINATHCVTLNLNTNLISEIEHGSFGSISILKNLSLDGNRLEEPRPNIFKELVVLEVLKLGNNAMRFIPNGLFTGLNNLRHLEMHENIFPDLKSNTFQGLDSLETLHLHLCHIRNIEPNAFYGLNQLKTLWIYQNELREITTDTFNGLSQVKYVYFYGNKLSTLDKNVFSKLSRPLTIAVSSKDTTTDNLDCDDKLCWLKKEEEAGTIQWYLGETFQPECKNDVNWNNWNCTEQAWEEENSRCSNNNSEEDQNVVLIASLSVCGGIIIGIVGTLVIGIVCLKRRDANICPQSKRGQDDEYIKPTMQLNSTEGGKRNQEESAASTPMEPPLLHPTSSIPREPPPPRPISFIQREPPLPRPVSSNSYATVYDNINDAYAEVE